MSRTDLDAHTLARSLRRMAGDGSVEWVMEPIQADVLRDIADMLDDTEATGGRQCDAGTCELINAADDLGKGTSSCMCFECGYTAIDDWWDEFKYCPNCGRRIEVDE